jgi:tRNA pseudouridine38-40 synthase
MLPPTIRILRISRAREDFHSRFSATGKIYRYDLWLGDVLPPHLASRAWQMPHPVDLALLRSTLELFVGRHDFRAFTANRGTRVNDTVRRIDSIRVTRLGATLRLTFQGSGFLYKMVRMLTGAGLRVAIGRDSAETIRHLLANPDTGRWTQVAPADGLHLVRVLY